MSFVAALQPTEIRSTHLFGTERVLPLLAVAAAVVTLLGVIAVLAQAPQVALVLTILAVVTAGLALTPGTGTTQVAEPDYR